MKNFIPGKKSVSTMLVVAILCYLLNCIAAFKRSYSSDSLEEPNKMMKIEEEPSVLLQPSWLFFRFMDALEQEDESDLLGLVYGGDFLVDGYMLCVRANEQITPLMMAAQKGNLTACMILIDAEAKVDLLSLETKRSVMDFAMESGNSELIEALQDHFESIKPPTPVIDLDLSSLAPVLEIFELIKNESLEGIESSVVTKAPASDEPNTPYAKRFQWSCVESNPDAVINNVDICDLVNSISPLESPDHWSYLVTKALELDFSEWVFDTIFQATFFLTELNSFGNQNVVTAFIKRMIHAKKFSKKGVYDFSRVLKELIARRPVNLNALDAEGQNPLLFALEKCPAYVPLALVKLGATGYPRGPNGVSPFFYITKDLKGKSFAEGQPIWDPHHNSELPSWVHTAINYPEIMSILAKNEIRRSYMTLACAMLDRYSILSILPKEIIQNHIGMALAIMHQQHFNH